MNRVDIGDGLWLSDDGARSWFALRDACRYESGVTLTVTPVNGAGRTREQQQALYDRYLAGDGELAAKPGESNHEDGLAVDIWNWADAREWLDDNAARFGMKRHPLEPWHYDVTDPLPEPAEIEEYTTVFKIIRQAGTANYWLVGPRKRRKIGTVTHLELLRRYLKTGEEQMHAGEMDTVLGYLKSVR